MYKAQIIEVFFFRMNLVTTLVGIAHGLIFVPVILAYFGPTVNKALLFENKNTESVFMLETERVQHCINHNPQELV